MMAIYNFLLWTGLMSVICVLPCLAIWPTYVIEEGETAIVPCIPKGDGQAFFWTEGENFETSEHVASRVLGIPSSISERYLTASNGSLLIFGANREDEGTYYCRIASENTNCFGAVSVFVQELYEFGIDECLGKGDCVIPVDPSEGMELTCSAELVPSWISLKWYNVLNETISVTSKEKPNNDSVNISERIQVSRLTGSLLICQAFDVRLGKPSAKVAYVRLEEISELEEQLPTTLVTVILAGLLFIFLLIVITIFTVSRYKWSKQRKKKRTYRQEKEELIVSKNDEMEEMKENHDTALKSKDDEIGMLKKKYKIELERKDSKIKTIEEDLKRKDSKIKTIEEDLKTMTEEHNKELTQSAKQIENLRREKDSAVKMVKEKDKRIQQLTQLQEP